VENYFSGNVLQSKIVIKNPKEKRLSNDQFYTFVDVGVTIPISFYHVRWRGPSSACTRQLFAFARRGASTVWSTVRVLNCRRPQRRAFVSTKITTRPSSNRDASSSRTVLSVPFASNSKTAYRIHSFSLPCTLSAAFVCSLAAVRFAAESRSTLVRIYCTACSHVLRSRFAAITAPRPNGPPVRVRCPVAPRPLRRCPRFVSSRARPSGGPWFPFGRRRQLRNDRQRLRGQSPGRRRKSTLDASVHRSHVQESGEHVRDATY